MRLMWSLLAVVVALLPGCIRIERHATGSSVPSAVLGAWNGSWSSSGSAGGGSVTLRVQTFDSQPVVQIDSAVPCLLAGSYEFRIGGARIELLRNGVTVLVGDVDLNSRRIVGSYQCESDAGAWTAQWLRPLPEVGDVTGSWAGHFVTGGGAGLGGDFSMALDQSWQHGVLRLDGTLEISGASDQFAIDSGNVNFDDTGFSLLLRGSQQGAGLLVQGVGSLSGTASCNGLLLLEAANIPIVVGSWTATRTGP